MSSPQSIIENEKLKIRDWNFLKKSKGEGGFHLNTLTLFLTYQDHFNKTDWVSWFEDNILGERKRISMEFCRLAHENGDPDGKGANAYQHTHVLIRFSRKFETRNERLFDYGMCVARHTKTKVSEVNGGSIVETIYTEGDNIPRHPHIRYLCGETHFTRCKRYIAKEDDENFDLLVSSIADNVLEHKTDLDALQCAKSFNEVMGILTIRDRFADNEANYNKLILEREYPDGLTFDPWMKEATTLLNGIWTRFVHWFFDPIGNIKKSYFAKFMAITDPEIIVLSGLPSQRDLAGIIKSKRNKGFTGDKVLIDLPRDYRDRDSIFEALECLKNGYFTSGKYDGSITRVLSCKIVVLANWAPQKFRKPNKLERDSGLSEGSIETLSDDRWDIGLISTKGFVCHQKNLRKRRGEDVADDPSDNTA